MIMTTFKKELPLLARLWLRLGRLLGKILLWTLVIGLLGWAVSSAWFAWQHRGPVPSREQIPEGEAAMTRDVIQTAVRIVDQHRESTRYLRDAHAKAHGCVKAEVQVLPELAQDLRRGVFSEPGKRWQATLRLSNGNAYPQFDSIRDARGMAIKLLDVPGKQLLANRQDQGEQDFVMFSHPNFLSAMSPNTVRTWRRRPTAKRSWRSSWLGPAHLAGPPPVHRPGDALAATGQPDADHLFFRVAVQVRRGQCKVQGRAGSGQLPGLHLAPAESRPAELPA